MNGRWRWGVLLVWLVIGGCTLPRIIALTDPLDAGQHNDLGVAYEHRGEFDLADREYRRAAELDQDWATPAVNLGNLAARQEQWPAAAAAYRQALDREPGRVEAMNNLAWVLTRAGQPSEALSWAQRAVTTAPADPRCWDTLADVYLALGRPAEAHSAAQQGLALDPPAALRSALEQKLTPRPQ